MSERLDEARQHFDTADRMAEAISPPELVIEMLITGLHKLTAAVEDLEAQHEKEKGT